MSELLYWDSKLKLNDIVNTFDYTSVSIGLKDVTKPPHQQVTNCCGNTCPQYQICNQAVKITVLASTYAKCATNLNGDSLILKVDYSRKTVYLPGDFEGD